MGRKPTLQDVADAVGLAPATVSYALRGERGSDATVERVRETADRLGYEINPIASALASGRSRTVGVLCGSTRDLWQQSLATGLSRELMARGRHAVVADADGRPERELALFAQLRAHRPDGMLVAPLDPFAALWRTAAEQVPLVSIGERLSQAPAAGAVVFDNAAGARLVFDHLAGLGHRRIVVVLPQRPSTPDRPAEALVAREAGRSRIDATLLHTPPATADPDTTTAHLAAALEGPDRPTAVFCLSDSFAFGVLRAARWVGLEVPHGLSVVGFEDVEIADLAGPGLTTVGWGRGAVIEAAVGQLLAAADAEEPADALTTTTIAPHLVVRGSTAGAVTTPT